MLDDLSYIHQIDKSDALGIAGMEPQQLVTEFSVHVDNSNIENVVYVAMGGSALAANLSQTWPGYRLPFEIVRSYHLPAFVSDKTLCILSSFSGNTEEVLSALGDAEASKAQIVVITSGGQLAKIAREKGYPLVMLPPAKQPRYGVFANFNALMEIGRQANIFLEVDFKLLDQAVKFLASECVHWSAVIPSTTNLAKQIALDCLGKSIVIYAGGKLAPAAYKWKISFNENAKQLAWQGTYSEFNHNEFIGWSEQPVVKPYAVVDLRSTYEYPEIQARFALSQRLLSGRRPDPIIIEARGSNMLEHLLYCVLLGDFVSIYAAIAAANNPEPVDLVEKLKLMLKNQYED